MGTQTEKEWATVAEPQKEHDWLQQLVGDWTFEVEALMEPGKPRQKSTGSERVRPLGRLWIVAEGEGQMPDGAPATTLQSIGYDPDQKRFVGTWMGSMMTHLWIYEGRLDAAERVLTLEARGPSMTGDGTLTTYRDVIEVKSKDHRVLRSTVLGDDGEWQEFMTANYRRRR